MGLLSLSNLAIYIKKAVLKLKNDFKGEIASKKKAAKAITDVKKSVKAAADVKNML